MPPPRVREGSRIPVSMGLWRVRAPALHGSVARTLEARCPLFGPETRVTVFGDMGNTLGIPKCVGTLRLKVG